MGKFIRQVAAFLVVLSVLNFLLFFLIRGFYIKDYDEVDLDYSSYILADSHGEALGDYPENHWVHNFSGQSDSYLDMERKLNFLIRNTPIKKVYVSVDDHTLSPTRENQNNLDRSAFYTERNDFSSYWDYFHARYLNYYCVFLNDRYSLVIKNFIQKELFAFTKWGGVRSKSSWEKLSAEQQREKSRERIRNYFHPKNPSGPLSDSLMRIIALCKSKDIELVGLRFPLTKSYVDMLDEESYRADSIFRMNHIPIIDLDSIYLEQDSLFRDMDHLDRKGGAKLAKVLFEGLQLDVQKPQIYSGQVN